MAKRDKQRDSTALELLTSERSYVAALQELVKVCIVSTKDAHEEDKKHAR